MLRWIIASSQKFRFIIVAVAADMMIFGILQLRSLPMDVFPEFAPPRVEIQTLCLGLTTEEVEGLVTVPLEQALNGTTDLDVIRSKSVPQLSSIELIFKPGTDLLHARQVVQERIAMITPTLPTWAAPPFMLQPLSTTSRVMKIGLSSKKVSLIDMSMISYWNIRARLLRVHGVADVAIWGERLKMLQVLIDPTRMLANKVMLEKVMDVTSDSVDSGLLKFSSGSIIGKGGFLETPNQRLGIEHVLPIISPNDLAHVPLGQNSHGKPILMRDVTDVVENHQPLIGDAVINDGPGLMLVVQKLPWGNTLEVTRGVEAALNELRPGLSDIDIDTTIFRPASFVESAVNNLSKTLLVGSLLVVIILSLFLFSWRSAFISLVAIPLSLMAAGLVLYLQGTTINTMILAGFVIAVGIVVDDAIIDVENIVRRLRDSHTKNNILSTARIILVASLEVRRSIVYATLINVVTLVPVLFLGGVSGAFFRPLAFSYALAVLASMLVALTVTPALSLILLSRASLTHREPPIVRFLKHGYGSMLLRIIQSPRPAYFVIACICLASLAVLPFLGESLFPAFKERDFLIHWVTKPGTSHPEEVRITEAGSRELRSIPGVRNFGSHIGQAFLADEVVGVNAGENWISIDPTVDYNKTLESIEKVVEGYSGLHRDVQTYLNERIEEVLAGSSSPIVVRIFGNDLDILRSKAEDIRQMLSGIDGIADEHVDLQEDVPQIEVKVDLNKAKSFGIKPGDVRRAAALLIAGEEVGDIFRDGKAYDVQVWSKPELRQSLTSIQELLLDTSGGGHVRLADVADVRIKPTPNFIHHEATVRNIDVGAYVRGRDLGAVVDEINDHLDRIKFPLGHHAELLGEYAERQATQERLMIFAIAAGIGVFTLLLMAYGSLRLTLLSFLTLPSALAGGVLAAYVGGGVISLGSLVGFFTVFGIAARNGIMLLNHYQHLERDEGMNFGSKLILRGAKERLSPILMTTLATGMAIIPLMILGDVPGHEIEHPMAIVIIGGLVTSTFLNLFVIPSLYLRFGTRMKRVI